MLIFTKIADLKSFLKPIKTLDQTVGFVPTMGALHSGHVSLIETSTSLCDVTICSIFVNPTQFNDKKDLERYPRMPEKDALILEKTGCDVLFMPSAEEIYPENYQLQDFDFGYLNSVLEGAHRPGHFNGVAQIVKRLFEIVNPNKAFFGIKDYQQVMIIKALIKKMQSNIEIITCPILREADGLAMSSRNALLTNDERKAASLVPKIMQEAKQIALQSGIFEAKQFVTTTINTIPIMKLDYYEICDVDLNSITDLKYSKDAVSLIALFVGKIRLIDNLEICH